MSIAIAGAIIAGGAGLAGAVGAAALGTAGLLGGAALSTAGAIGSLGVGAASGLVSGVGGLFAGPAAGVAQTTLAGVPYSSMAGQAAYYGTGQVAAGATGAGILGGVIPAVTQTIGYLGEMAPALGGIFGIMKPAEKAVIPTARAPVPAVTSPGIAKSALPIFSQSPKVMTVGGPAETPGPNYMIYIALAVGAYFLLRKK